MNRVNSRNGLAMTTVDIIITFRVSRRRREMYCGDARLCLSVCMCVCRSAAACPHYCTDPDVTRGVVGDAT